MINFSLDGKVALVTGGGTGLGLGAAKCLAAIGAKVYIVGRRKKVLQEAATSIDGNVVALTADVSKRGDMQRVAKAIKEQDGKLDIIFSNAGYCLSKDLVDLDDEFFDAMFNVNVKGTLHTIQSMLPIMQDGGSIILTSSMTASIGLQGYTTYAATKSALEGMAKCWVTELKGRKIRVNVVKPGAIPTDGYQTVQGMSDADVNEFMTRVSDEIPAGRGGMIEELGNVVSFLASDASAFVNGEQITVDGGQTLVYAGKL